MAVDPGNAHVRRRPRRTSVETAEADAKRLLDDPAFVRAHEIMRAELVRQLEETKPDGTPEFDEREREVCRTLRTLQGVVKAIAKGGQLEELRLAQFRPAPAEEGDE